MNRIQSHRISSNSAAINRQKLVHFKFDNKKYTGCEGDTLASALLAHGVHLVGRSFKYHRPRGIFGSGSEEPNALVRLISDKSSEPNLRATQIEIYDGLIAESQNRFPSLKIDFLSINNVFRRFFPAGFYYKTFMWPTSFWMFYEKLIRKAAGLGKISKKSQNSERYEHKYAHCDLLVVGGGAAGLQTAIVAAKSGARVIIADEQHRFGGWLLTDNNFKINQIPAASWTDETLKNLQSSPNVNCLSRTTVSSMMDDNFVIMAERVTEHLGKKICFSQNNAYGS